MNRQRRWKRLGQARYHKSQEEKLKHAAVVKGDTKAQAKLDVAHAERQLKAYKNVRFLVGRKHAKRTMAKLDGKPLGKSAKPRGK